MLIIGAKDQNKGKLFMAAKWFRCV